MKSCAQNSLCFQFFSVPLHPNHKLKYLKNAKIMSVQKTRALLVDVARQLFAKNGFEDTSMNDIAVAANRGRRTLYTYFNSTEEIYLAVIQTELERW